MLRNTATTNYIPAQAPYTDEAQPLTVGYVWAQVAASFYTGVGVSCAVLGARAIWLVSTGTANSTDGLGAWAMGAGSVGVVAFGLSCVVRLSVDWIGLAMRLAMLRMDVDTLLSDLDAEREKARQAASDAELARGEARGLRQGATKPAVRPVTETVRGQAWVDASTMLDAYYRNGDAKMFTRGAAVAGLFQGSTTRWEPAIRLLDEAAIVREKGKNQGRELYNPRMSHGEALAALDDHWRKTAGRIQDA